MIKLRKLQSSMVHRGWSTYSLSYPAGLHLPAVHLWLPDAVPGELLEDLVNDSIREANASGGGGLPLDEDL